MGTGDEERLVEGIEQLYQELQQVAAIARTMPNRVADQFRTKTQNLPKTTEAERIVLQRVGHYKRVIWASCVGFLIFKISSTCACRSLMLDIPSIGCALLIRTLCR